MFILSADLVLIKLASVYPMFISNVFVEIRFSPKFFTAFVALEFFDARV